MKYFNFFILCFFVVASSINAQKHIDYRDYHKLANYANYLLFKGDSINGLAIYDSLIEKYTLFPINYFRIGKIHFFSGNYSKAFQFWEKSILGGYTLSDINNEIYPKIIDSTFKVKLKVVEQKFLNTVDSNLILTFDTLIKRDQKYRVNRYGMDDSTWYKKIEITDKNNLVSLYRVIADSGWPSYQSVGFRYLGGASIILLHALRFYPEDHEYVIFFNTVLKEQITKGKYSPNFYANQVDQTNVFYYKKKQIYGSMADMNNVLFPHIDIDEIEKNRNEIGLGLLNEYLQIKGYKLE